MDDVYKQVTVGKLLPNHHRNFDEYPIQKEKVDQLRANYRSTGFWGNIVARQNGNEYEIAFGHHRLKALQDEYGEKKRIEVIVRDVSDGDMLKMMAQENMEEFGTNAFVELETIEAALRAVANGELELEPMGVKVPKAKIRHVNISDINIEYTPIQIAKALGWASKCKEGVQPNQACQVAFKMLDALELGIVNRAQLRGLKRSPARALVESALAIRKEHLDAEQIKRKAAEEAEDAGNTRKANSLRNEAAYHLEAANNDAKEFINDNVAEIRSADKGIRDIRKAASKKKEEVANDKLIRIANAAKLLEKYRKKILMVLHPDEEPHASFIQLLEMKGELDQSDVRKLGAEVEALAKRAATFAKYLRRWNSAKPSPVPEALALPKN